MKKYLSIVCLGLLISCQKQATPTPAPAPAPAPQANPLSAQQQFLEGDWLLKRVDFTLSGTTTTTLHNSPQCHLNLTSTVSTSDVTRYDAIQGIGCSDVADTWKVFSVTQFYVGGSIFTINYQCQDSMVLQANAYEVYYLKR